MNYTATIPAESAPPAATWIAFNHHRKNQFDFAAAAALLGRAVDRSGQRLRKKSPSSISRLRELETCPPPKSKR